ncbi:MAG: OmpH family outer membrane protein [Bacteroidales bacterium]|jgi:outer membrane protein|nr:OmpH family outer membrane protein [Bacteroidales bacterium]
MKRLNLILESVLFVAVVVLFVLFFTQKPSSAKLDANGEVVETPTATDGAIVYVRIDSLMQNYQMFKDLAEELKAKSQTYDAELNSKVKKFQANVTDFQNKATKGLETRAKLGEMEQQLQADQQNLAQLRDNYAMQLSEEEQVMNRKCLQSIMDYLVEFNKDKGYQYILGNTFGGNVLYSQPSLDVTETVIKGLNAGYTKPTADPAKK